MKTILLLVAIQLAANGADAYLTDRNMRVPGGYENNPIAQPFVHSGGGRVAYFSAWAAGRTAGTLFLQHHEHRRLATALALEGIADNGYGAVTSWRGYQSPGLSSSLRTKDLKNAEKTRE